MKLDRRKILKLIPAGLAGGVATPGLVTASQHDEFTTTPTADGDYDVAVVGVGVAGCYVAYRLTQAKASDFKPSSPLLPILKKNGKLKVALFEYSGRIGGRLLAAELPGIGDGPRKYAEFGGFRFQPQMHIVNDLASHLGLLHEPFTVDEPLENFIYLRGQRFRRGDLVTGVLAEKLYRFTDAEAKLLAAGGDFSTYTANQAFSKVLDQELVRTLKAQYKLQSDPYDGDYNGYTTLRSAYHKAFLEQKWEDVKQLRELYESAKLSVVVDQRSLIDWSWWALLTRYLSQEAIAYYEDSGGYNQLWTSGNVFATLREDFYFATAEDTYPKIYGPDKSPTPEQTCTKTAWKHITTGYSDIPNQMFKAFLKSDGAQAYLNHQLVGFDKANRGGYDLNFFDRESGTLTSGQAEASGTQQPKSATIFNAKYLVLALPKNALKQLDRSTFFLRNPTVIKLINTVLNDPAIRIFMAYKEPWWLQAKGDTYPAPTCGRSTTDLNVRQFYYWHTAEPAAENQNSFVLASYSNGQAEAYWRRLQYGVTSDQLKGSVYDESRHDGPQGRGPRVAES